MPILSIHAQLWIVFHCHKMFIKFFVLFNINKLGVTNSLRCDGIELDSSLSDYAVLESIKFKVSG